MFVAFCDHERGNSTPRCSNATRSPCPMRASRTSHSTSSNGCTPACVKKRLIGSATPAALSFEVIGLRGGVIGFPLSAPAFSRRPSSFSGAEHRPSRGGRKGDERRRLTHLQF